MADFPSEHEEQTPFVYDFEKTEARIPLAKGKPKAPVRTVEIIPTGQSRCTWVLKNATGGILLRSLNTYTRRRAARVGARHAQQQFARAKFPE